MLARALIALTAFLLPASVSAQTASNLKLVDLTDDFAALFDRTAVLGDAARVAAIKAHFEPIIPGFYGHERHGLPDATRYDQFVLKALKSFPKEREAIAGMSRRFATLLAPAEQSFEREFGPLTGFADIYLVHSLGEFDGGMRELGGKGHLMFGADVMAKIYAGRAIQPFFHHELFHLYHSRSFDDCDKIWCGLWNEGLATYVAHRMNPSATVRRRRATAPKGAAMADQATPNLPSPDFESTSRFYGSLGFAETWRDDGWMILKRGELALEFFPFPDLDPYSSSFSCCLRLDDLDAFYAVCQSAGPPEARSGIPRVVPPRVERSGLRIAYLVDPHGTLVRLIQNA